MTLTLVLSLLAAACGTRVDDKSVSLGDPFNPGANGQAATGTTGVPGASGTGASATTAGGATGTSSSTGGSGPGATGTGTSGTASTGGTGAPGGTASTGGSGGTTGTGGSGTPSGTAGTGGPSAPAKIACDPGVDGKPLQLGGTFPLSGPVGFLGKSELAAMDTYAKWFNSRGGYCGRKMEVVALDDGMEPTRQLANMRKLNDEYKVLAAGTILTVGVGDYVTRNNLPVLALGGAIEPFSTKQPTVFPALGSALQFTGAFINGLEKNKTIAKGDKVAIMYDTEIFNLAPIKDDIAAEWKKAGYKVVSLDAFNLSNLDCSSLLNKMKSLDIDYWDFQSFGWVLCVAAGSRSGYIPKKGWGGWTASSAGIPELAGRAANNVWHGGASRIDPTYAKLMKLYHPAESETEADLAAPPAIGVWALMGQFEKVLREGDGNLTREQIVTSFQKVKRLIFMGKEVQVNFDPKCKGGTVPTVGSSFTMAQWRYNPANERFARAFMGGEIGNPYLGPCDASKLASEKY